MNIINIILVRFELSINSEDVAPETSVQNKDGERRDKPEYVDNVNITVEAVSVEDGEADDDAERDTAQAVETIEEEPGQHGSGLVSESSTDHDTVDDDGEERVDHLSSQSSVGVTSVVESWTIPEHQTQDSLDTHVLVRVVMTEISVAGVVVD